LSLEDSLALSSIRRKEAYEKRVEKLATHRRSKTEASAGTSKDVDSRRRHQTADAARQTDTDSDSTRPKKSKRITSDERLDLYLTKKGTEHDLKKSKRDDPKIGTEEVKLFKFPSTTQVPKSTKLVEKGATKKQIPLKQLQKQL
jgi:protein-tyrosine-phosphatase